MAPLGPIGKSWLLVCCGSIFHVSPPKDGATSLKATGTTGISSERIAQMKHDDQNTMLSIPKNSNGAVNININFGQSGLPPDISTADESRLKLKSGKNVLQINVFNDGAPKIVSQGLPAQIIPSIDGVPSNNQNDLPSQIKTQHEPMEGILITQSSKTTETTSELPWWKTSVIYQIYPRSFMDSSGSGTGDLKGITSKVSYLKELGIGAVWLSPVYVSPMADFGYDVADFIDIDPIFGTLEDFDELVNALHSVGIKIIMDFIPNHTSDKHQWFEKSVKKIDPYTDYYVWENATEFNESGNPIPPNNWLSVFRFSAWEWNEERQQFYLHQFLKEQPDLNVRNPAVLEELQNVVKFWLDRGVDGFRIDALKHMFEVEDMSLDEPVALDSGAKDPQEYGYLNHTYSVNLPETVDAVRQWRKLADLYDDRMMMVEVYDPDIGEIMKYYGNDTDRIAHFPFNFYLISDLNSRDDVTGTNLKKTLDTWLDDMPPGKWPNWVLGNHDRPRVATRLGTDLVDALNIMSLLLPGTPTTYYGEEIGMEGTFVTFEQVKDPFGLNFGPERYQEFGRDPERTPMQWDNSSNAGFSTANSTWLPINDNYLTLNVENQENSQESHLKVYQALTKLRKEKSFTNVLFEYVLATDDALAFARYLPGEPRYLVVINTSVDQLALNLRQDSMFPLPQTGTVMIRSISDQRAETSVGSTLSLDSLSLLGGEGIVLKLND